MAKIKKVTPLNDGMDAFKAENLWKAVEKFAAYSFNKSHSTAYTLISYQSMWLKVKFPIEFYAAAMTIMGDDKKAALIRDAEKRGIVVQPPDVNLSTDEFEILDEETLIAPFSIMKGLSERGALEILDARKSGPFASLEDFENRVPRRVVNKTVRDKLDRVGAFYSIEPGQAAPDDPSRRKDQLEFVPAITPGGAIVTRQVNKSRAAKAELVKVMAEFRDGLTEEEGKDEFVSPRMGRSARFMVVFDGPNYHDTQAGRFATSANEVMIEALENAGLDIADGYWTALSKTPKRDGEKMWSAEMMNRFRPLLEKELDLLNPQIVVCLGSNAARHFDPALKGPVADNAGRVIYKPATEQRDDCNVVIGITPGMVFFDNTKQALINETFEIVKRMIDDGTA